MDVLYEDPQKITMEKECSNCKKRKEHHAKGLCYNCYRKIWSPKKAKCKRCGEEKITHAKGLCDPCYNLAFRSNENKAWNYEKKYGLRACKYRKITEKCVICNFKDVVDLHAIDSDKKNIA